MTGSGEMDGMEALDKRREKGDCTSPMPRIGIRRFTGQSSLIPLTTLLVASSIIFLVAATLQIPDTASTPAATTLETVNDSRSVGQTFRAERNGLSRIDLVLAAGGRVQSAPLRFYLREAPGSSPIRTVLLDNSGLPIGDPWRFVPGRMDETWMSFNFEPIPDSAGRQFYFSLEGPGIPPEGTVRTLVFFHNQYPYGQAYVNGEPIWAHIVFRAYSWATPFEALHRVLGNLIIRKLGVLGFPASYVILGAIYVIAAVALLRQAWLFGLTYSRKKCISSKDGLGSSADGQVELH